MSSAKADTHINCRVLRKGVRQLAVFINDRRVGTLAQTPEGLAAFEYDPAWIEDGFSISPLSLPLKPGVYIPKPEPFNGVFGVFQDSMPDGWGALLMSRMLRQQGVDADAISPLTMLALVGSRGRGALRYRPELLSDNGMRIDDLDAFSKLCGEILDDKPVDNLDEAYAAGGSSAGARPKAYIDRGSSQWLVKFPSSMDPKGIGSIEYAYSIAARECGIVMAPTELLSSTTCDGFFATERFDRDANGNGIHMVTASGLLEISHRFPVLDYAHLFQLTQMLTHDQTQAWQVFRLMCFNVFSHNQDDHSNNFAWLCDSGSWHLSPAYDLTHSTSFGNEHATTVNGSGDPTIEDLLALAKSAGLPPRKARCVAEEIRDRCAQLLSSLGL